MDFFEMQRKAPGRPREPSGHPQYKGRVGSPNIHQLASEAFGGQRNANQYTSVWKKLDVQRPYTTQNGSMSKWSDKGSLSSPKISTKTTVAKKRAALCPLKCRLTKVSSLQVDSPDVGGFGPAQYFTQSSMNQLKDFFAGGQVLDKATIEQMLLPPRTYHLYKSTDTLRRSIEPQLERDMERISEDIDNFMMGLNSLFEEIKKLLLSKTMQAEYDLKEYLTTFTQNVDRYLKDASLTLMEDKRRNQYMTLEVHQYENNDSNHMDREIADMKRQKKTMEMTEKALKVIRNFRRNYKIVEMTEALDTLLTNDLSIYQRDQFRRSFGDLRDDLVMSIENLDLFRDNNIVKKLKISSQNQNSASNTQSFQTKLGENYLGGSEGKLRPQVSPSNLLLIKRPRGSHNLPAGNTITDLSQSGMSQSHYSEQKQFGPKKGVLQGTRDYTPTTLKPAENLIYGASNSNRGSVNDSLLGNLQHRKLLEEREKEFKRKVEDPMWHSKAYEDAGHLTQNQTIRLPQNSIQKETCGPQQPPPPPQDDNLSWKFLESIKKNLFG